ncbi:MAG: cytochrome c oxidase subunit II [Flammeovirgaceae bacterium]|nr:cytochrome c oxidase subunit II [Flammeovirgaceae bacterium]
MAALLLISGVVFLVAILALIYRIFTLVSIAKGSTKQRVSTSNKINAILFPILFVVGFGAIFIYSGIASEDFLPVAASAHGSETDFLFWLTMAIIGVAFFATHVLLFWFPFKYQFKESRSAYFQPHNDTLEIIWTVVPALVMTGLVLSGWMVWTDITSPAPDDAVKIEVMGKQFNWEVRYPGKDSELGKHNFRKIDATNSMGIDFRDPKSIDDFIARDIHLPKGQPVLLKIRARDVLHSVFMPHFRVKMDAVPGMPTQFWFTPIKTTAEMREELSLDPAWQKIDPKTGEPRFKNFNYELACTEVCGSGHFAMRKVIIVDEPAEFNKWYNEQDSWASKNKEYLSSIGINLDLADNQ